MFCGASRCGLVGCACGKGNCDSYLAGQYRLNSLLRSLLCNYLDRQT